MKDQSLPQSEDNNKLAKDQTEDVSDEKDQTEDGNNNQTDEEKEPKKRRFMRFNKEKEPKKKTKLNYKRFMLLTSLSISSLLLFILRTQEFSYFYLSMNVFYNQ